MIITFKNNLFSSELVQKSAEILSYFPHDCWKVNMDEYLIFDQPEREKSDIHLLGLY